MKKHLAQQQKQHQILDQFSKKGVLNKAVNRLKFEDLDFLLEKGFDVNGLRVFLEKNYKKIQNTDIFKLFAKHGDKLFSSGKKKIVLGSMHFIYSDDAAKPNKSKSDKTMNFYVNGNNLSWISIPDSHKKTNKYEVSYVSDKYTMEITCKDYAKLTFNLGEYSLKTQGDQESFCIALNQIFNEPYAHRTLKHPDFDPRILKSLLNDDVVDSVSHSKHKSKTKTHVKVSLDDHYSGLIDKYIKRLALDISKELGAHKGIKINYDNSVYQIYVDKDEINVKKCDGEALLSTNLSINQDPFSFLVLSHIVMKHTKKPLPCVKKDSVDVVEATLRSFIKNNNFHLVYDVTSSEHGKQTSYLNVGSLLHLQDGLDQFTDHVYIGNSPESFADDGTSQGASTVIADDFNQFLRQEAKEAKNPNPNVQLIQSELEKFYPSYRECIERLVKDIPNLKTDDTRNAGKVLEYMSKSLVNKNKVFQWVMEIKDKTVDSEQNIYELLYRKIKPTDGVGPATRRFVPETEFFSSEVICSTKFSGFNTDYLKQRLQILTNTEDLYVKSTYEGVVSYHKITKVDADNFNLNQIDSPPEGQELIEIQEVGFSGAPVTRSHSYLSVSPPRPDYMPVPGTPGLRYYAFIDEYGNSVVNFAKMVDGMPDVGSRVDRDLFQSLGVSPGQTSDSEEVERFAMEFEQSLPRNGTVRKGSIVTSPVSKQQVYEALQRTASARQSRRESLFGGALELDREVYGFGFNEPDEMISSESLSASVQKVIPGQGKLAGANPKYIYCPDDGQLYQLKQSGAGIDIQYQLVQTSLPSDHFTTVRTLAPKYFTVPKGVSLKSGISDLQTVPEHKLEPIDKAKIKESSALAQAIKAGAKHIIFKGEVYGVDSTIKQSLPKSGNVVLIDDASFNPKDKATIDSYLGKVRVMDVLEIHPKAMCPLTDCLYLVPKPSSKELSLYKLNKVDSKFKLKPVVSFIKGEFEKEKFDLMIRQNLVLYKMGGFKEPISSKQLRAAKLETITEKSFKSRESLIPITSGSNAKITTIYNCEKKVLHL